MVSYCNCSNEVSRLNKNLQRVICLCVARGGLAREGRALVLPSAPRGAAQLFSEKCRAQQAGGSRGAAAPLTVRKIP